MRSLKRKPVGDTRADPRWRPLEVVATLSEPLVYFDDGLHLDGILGWAAVQQYKEERGRGVGHCKPGWLGDLDLPLARWAVPAPRPQRYHSWMMTRDHEHVWGWCASGVLGLERTAVGRVEIRKRPETTEMARWTEASKHQLGTGPLKAYDLSLPALTVRELRWSALGDPSGVRELLERVTHVGKKCALGMGKVAEWSVREAADDWSIAREGKLTRRMPDPTGKSGLVAAVRAPYQDPNRRMPALDIGEPWGDDVARKEASV